MSGGEGEPGRGAGDEGVRPLSAHELYGELWAGGARALDAELGSSLAPRARSMLYDELGRLGANAGSVVLDAGARDAVHAVELVRRFGCRVVAVDPVSLHAERAKERIAGAGLEDRIDLVEAALESLPLEDASVDLVWCRDVLNHVILGRALPELVRVLRPEGSALVYQTFAEPSCEPEELRRLCAASASVPENMSPVFFEQAAHAAGLEVMTVERLQGEWRERMIEDGEWDAVADLLALSRLHRREQELVERHGRTRVAERRDGGLLWGLYQLLGKTCPTIYVLRRR